MISTYDIGVKNYYNATLDDSVASSVELLIESG